MKIIVTGGCGYKGTVLVRKLLNRGCIVTVIDAMWFGSYLTPHHNLTVLKQDIRDVEKIQLEGVHAIIHLASVANDPCSELNPKLTWEISALATMQLADKAVRSGVKHFIYASSGSVYGIKDEDQVTEDLELNPISEYNKTKMVSERVLLSYSNDLIMQIIRPATVCGFSPRMRLDVAVNALTISALVKNEITVYGGSQIRPNIHIDDVTDLYLHMLDKGNKATGIYNAGFENISILDIAKKVTRYLPAKIIIKQSSDPRSYRINSDKVLNTGFSPKKNVDDAIEDMISHFNKGSLKDKEEFYNLKWMQKIGF